jgi:hypothetical protein
MLCRLCGQPNKLVKAHAIPEAFFRDLHPEDQALRMFGSSPSAFPKRAPIGPYDEGILCDRCEPTFGAVDNYGIQVLLKRLHQLFLPVSEGASIAAFQASGLDQEMLLRFLVATLWRAAVSTHHFYRSVQLGPYEDRAKQAILNPGQQVPEGFGAVLSCWATDDEHQFSRRALLDPSRERWDDIRGYRIYFGEVVAFMKVDAQPFPPDLRAFALRSQTSTTLIARSFRESSDLAAMRYTATESHKHHERRRNRLLAKGR